LKEKVRLELLELGWGMREEENDLPGGIEGGE